MLEREEINMMGMQLVFILPKILPSNVRAVLSRPRKEDKDGYISGTGLSRSRGGIGNQANTIRTNRE